ncbi:MAG: TolC family protein [Candidatus Moduliflexus flocculans]|nr:TolC family protein [Candidatus Moduliflexus flocculans]
MTLSLEEAEKFFIENNPDVKAKRAEIGKADADIIEAQAIPNPSLRYELESLKDGERETEQTFSVSQSLDIFRKRSKKREAAEKRREAGALLLDHDVTEMTVQMKQTYCRIFTPQGK